MIFLAKREPIPGVVIGKNKSLTEMSPTAWATSSTCSLSLNKKRRAQIHVTPLNGPLSFSSHFDLQVNKQNSITSKSYRLSVPALRTFLFTRNIYISYNKPLNDYNLYPHETMATARCIRGKNKSGWRVRTCYDSGGGGRGVDMTTYANSKVKGNHRSLHWVDY